MSTPVLDMRDVWIHDARGRALVCGLDLWADAEHALGLVGESGSGKTLTARAALGVLPKGISVDAACIRLCGTDVYTASPYERRRLLGTQVGYVPQNTLGYLQPALRVHTQIIDGYRTWHPDVSRADALERAAGLLDAVGIAEPEVVLARYPGELSGGQRQRVNIAMALMGDPALIVADEPTAALDSITAVQVIDLLFRVARDRGVALLMISHDLGLVRERCDQVCVMYAGRSVEEGGCDIVLHDPGHPYTCGLLAAVPHGDPHERGGERLAEIPGVMPRDGRDRNACVFAPRCPLADEGCEAALPPLRARTAESDHRVACFHAWELSRDEASVPAAAGQRDEGDAL